eukprot:6473344-Amphidinium_carterae.2
MAIMIVISSCFGVGESQDGGSVFKKQFQSESVESSVMHFIEAVETRKGRSAENRFQRCLVSTAVTHQTVLFKMALQSIKQVSTH